MGDADGVAAARAAMARRLADCAYGIGRQADQAWRSAQLLLLLFAAAAVLHARNTEADAGAALRWSAEATRPAAGAASDERFWRSVFCDGNVLAYVAHEEQPGLAGVRGQLADAAGTPTEEDDEAEEEDAADEAEDEDDGKPAGLSPDWVRAMAAWGAWPKATQLWQAACHVFGLTAKVRAVSGRSSYAGLLDPCSNALGKPNVPAETVYTKSMDGLDVKNKWSGVAYVNPPWSHSVWPETPSRSR